MSIKEENISLSKTVVKYIIEELKKNKNLKLYYEKDNIKYNCGYLDMTIKSNYILVSDYKNYYTFDVTINNIESANKDFKLYCCLNNKDLKEFDIGKHIYGLCYYNSKYNSFSTAYGILFDNFASSKYDDSYYDLIDLNTNIFKIISEDNRVSFNRIINTDFYILNFKE